MQVSLSGLKVLCVDDDSDLLELLVEGLGLMGAQTSGASGVRAAAERLRTESFDVVVSDMRMPDGDGLFLARAVKAMPAPRPVFLILSGYNDLTKSDCEQADISVVLSKPIPLSELGAQILKQRTRVRGSDAA